jgi:hypothetical protein
MHEASKLNAKGEEDFILREIADPKRGVGADLAEQAVAPTARRKSGLGLQPFVPEAFPEACFKALPKVKQAFPGVGMGESVARHVPETDRGEISAVDTP